MKMLIIKSFFILDQTRINPEEITLQQGSDITLSCKGTGTITWTFNHKILPRNAHQHAYIPKYLTLSNVQGSNNGYYECNEELNGRIYKARAKIVVTGRKY